MTKTLSFISALALTVAMSGCANWSSGDTGTVLGGIAGGAAGSQIGSGRGTTIATVVGTLAGAALIARGDAGLGEHLLELPNVGRIGQKTRAQDGPHAFFKEGVVLILIGEPQYGHLYGHIPSF